MAVENPNDPLFKVAFNRPIPGESLVNSPEEPYPWEKPTEFNSVYKASEYLFEELTDEDMYPAIISLLDKGTPVLCLAQIILFRGFNEGKWNPDLIMLLLEPTVYMLASLAERADIDFVLDVDDDEEENYESQFTTKTKFNVLKNLQDPEVQSVSPELEEKIDEVSEKLPSLLDKEQ